VKAASADDLILWDVFEEHLEEAAFLLSMWRSRLLADNYTFDELRTGPEQRLRLHVDALVIGGPRIAERLLHPALMEGEPEQATVAALAMLDGARKKKDALQTLIAIMEATDPARSEALGAALVLCEQGLLPELLLAEVKRPRAPEVRARLLDALAEHGRDAGPALSDALQDETPALQRAGLAAVAASGRRDAIFECEQLLRSPDGMTRNLAFDAALTLSSPEAWAQCLSRSRRPEAEDGHCLLLRSLLGGAGDHAWLLRLFEAGEALPAVLWAMGFGGQAAYVEPLLTALDHEESRVAKLAAEAFCAITGFDPYDESDVTQQPSVGSSVQAKAGDETEADEAEEEGQGDDFAFEDEDLDADLVPDAVEQLPSLERAQAEAWWKQKRGDFDRESRYIAGERLELSSVVAALGSGPARRRHAWALGIAIASGSAYRVSTRAFCSRQQPQMDALAKAKPGELGRLL